VLDWRRHPITAFVEFQQTIAEVLQRLDPMLPPETDYTAFEVVVVICLGF
jgi:hypothetical protein